MPDEAATAHMKQQCERGPLLMAKQKFFQNYFVFKTLCCDCLLFSKKVNLVHNIFVELKTVLKKDTAVSVFIFHPYQRLKRQLRLKIGRASLTLPL